MCFIFTASAAIANVCIAFFTTPASAGQEGISGKYPILLASAEGDMLAQNASNPGITIDLIVSISNKLVSGTLHNSESSSSCSPSLIPCIMICLPEI